MIEYFLSTGGHNNISENVIQPNMIIHKITNGNHSDGDAKAHKILRDIKETCRSRDLKFHDYMEEYDDNLISKF